MVINASSLSCGPHSPLTYHWSWIKLRDDVMEENGEVSGPRLQQVQTLKRATFSINLRQREGGESGTLRLPALSTGLRCIRIFIPCLSNIWCHFL